MIKALKCELQLRRGRQVLREGAVGAQGRFLPGRGGSLAPEAEGMGRVPGPWGVLSTGSAVAVEMLCAVCLTSDILFQSCLKGDWKLSL